MPTLVKYYLLMAILLTGLFAVAEEPASSPPDPAAASGEKTASDKNSDKNEATQNSESRQRPKAPEFDPSEQISEDLSVPFPVDI